MLRKLLIRISVLALVAGLFLVASPATPNAEAATSKPCSTLMYTDSPTWDIKFFYLTCGKSTFKLSVNVLEDYQVQGLPATDRRSNFTVDSVLWESGRMMKLSVWVTDSHGTKSRKDDTSWLVSRNLKTQYWNQLTTVPANRFGD